MSRNLQTGCECNIRIGWAGHAQALCFLKPLQPFLRHQRAYALLPPPVHQSSPLSAHRASNAAGGHGTGSPLSHAALPCQQLRLGLNMQARCTRKPNVIWKPHAVWIIDASFVTSNPTRRSFVIAKGSSYEPKSKNDSRVVLVAEAVGCRTQRRKRSGDQVIALSRAHIRPAGQAAHGSAVFNDKCQRARSAPVNTRTCCEFAMSDMKWKSVHLITPNISMALWRERANPGERHDLNNWRSHTIIMHLKVQQGKALLAMLFLHCEGARPGLSAGGWFCLEGWGGGGVGRYVRASSSTLRGRWLQCYFLLPAPVSWHQSVLPVHLCSTSGLQAMRILITGLKPQLEPSYIKDHSSTNVNGKYCTEILSLGALPLKIK